jgi:hypothetical protein
MLMVNSANLILNKNVYIKSYIFTNFEKLLTLNSYNKSYHFKLLKIFKYVFLTKYELKKKKKLKKQLILLNIRVNNFFFFIKKKKLYNSIKGSVQVKYLFKTLYHFFIKQLLPFSSTKKLNKNLLKDKILQYKTINLTRFIYNFKKKNILNFNIYYIKHIEKKKINSVYTAILQKESGELINRDLLCALNLLIKQPVLSLKATNVFDENKTVSLAVKNSFYTKLKSIYYLYYFFLKKNH